MVSGQPYPIRDGRVTNVPAGTGGKRRTISMLVDNQAIVESVAAFQARDYPAAPHPAAHTRAGFHVLVAWLSTLLVRVSSPCR